MYCSGIVTFDAIHVSSVTPISAGPLFTYLVIALMITLSCPVASMIPPNIIAIIVMRIDSAIPMSPPLVRSVSSALIPLSIVYPFIALSKIAPSVAPFWNIGAIIAATITPSVMPGIAGIFSAIARITTNGGRSRIGLTLKLSLIPFTRISSCDVSACPLLACINPYTPKNTSAII